MSQSHSLHRGPSHMQGLRVAGGAVQATVAYGPWAHGISSLAVHHLDQGCGSSRALLSFLPPSSFPHPAYTPSPTGP